MSSGHSLIILLDLPSAGFLSDLMSLQGLRTVQIRTVSQIQPFFMLVKNYFIEPSLFHARHKRLITEPTLFHARRNHYFMEPTLFHVGCKDHTSPSEPTLFHVG